MNFGSLLSLSLLMLSVAVQSHSLTISHSGSDAQQACTCSLSHGLSLPQSQLSHSGSSWVSLSLSFLAHSLQTQSWDLPNVTLHFNVDVLLLGAWILGVSTSWCVIEFNKVRLIFCSILFFQVRHPGWYHCSDVWLIFVYWITDYILKSSLSPHPEIILLALPPAIFPSVLFTSDSYHYIQFALYAFRLVVQIFDLPSPTCVATIWLPVHGHPTLYKVNPPRQKHEMCSGP